MQNNEATLTKHQLSYDYFLKPFHCPCDDSKLEYFHAIDVARDANYADNGVVNMTMLNVSIPIKHQGVHNLAFLYEVMNKTKKIVDAWLYMARQIRINQVVCRQFLALRRRLNSGRSL